MKINYVATIKFNLTMETDMEVSEIDIPTQLDLDNGVKELILDDIGNGASCTIDIESAYELIR